MSVNFFLRFLCLIVSASCLLSCGTKKEVKESDKIASGATSSVSVLPSKSSQLPVRFQTPAYVAPAQSVGIGRQDQANDDYQIKVGATIRSTGGPQPLWEVMKRLANLKGMTVSWASDVDQTVLVDVDISASDNFYDAVSNLLRQADLFHDVTGNSIVVKNKATKVYQIGIPAIKGGFSTNVGGNFLANKEAASGAEGTVKITSPENNFNVWDSVEANLKKILQIAAEERQEILASVEAATSQKIVENQSAAQGKANNTATTPEANSIIKTSSPSHAKDGGYYIIDKNIGLITVTAKPSLLKTVDAYIDNLKKSLYQQVNIEAKIIEVYLQDNSKVGLNWDDLLGGEKSIGTTISFGNAGQVYPHGGTDGTTYASSFVSRVQIGDLSFSTLINALKQQGDTRVLANPRVTVLNGQPALISVGKDVAYIKSVTREKDDDTNSITYTAETSNVVQGIALGVIASILDNKRLVLHLTPITTEIENLDSDGNIIMTTVGSDDTAMSLGLPQVKVREMSTMVEVTNGEMLIIGGLIDSTEGKSGSFAPGVGDVPVLKYLFGYEEKTMQKRELVILLTPTII